MKAVFLFTTLIIILLMSNKTDKPKTEHQPYTLVQKFPGFEVRYYPEAIVAKINSTATSYREMTSPSFRALAGYIFGGNETNQKIAMTAPVHIDFDENGSSMAFVMPEEYEMEELPVPENASVKLERTAPGYWATLTFGGYANDEKIKDEREKLRQLLKENDLKPIGRFEFRGYNAPYKFWNRRNEVAVPILWE